MPIQNSDVAEIFNRVADLLDIQGENRFRIRAYRSTARIMAELPQRVAEMVDRDEDLSQLPGIGKDLAGISCISAKSFVLTTSLGILPGALCLTCVGSWLGSVRRPEDIFSGELYLALSILGIFALSRSWFPTGKASRLFQHSD